MNPLDPPPLPLPRGVTRTKSAFIAQIAYGKTVIYLGSFRTVELASAAYEAAVIERDAVWPVSPELHARREGLRRSRESVQATREARARADVLTPAVARP